MSTPQLFHAAASAEFFFREGCHIVEHWNHDADADVSVAQARVEPGVTTRWHRVVGLTERYVVLAGHGRVEVGELAPAMVKAGDVVLIPPGVRQRICNVGDVDLVFLAVCTPRFRPACYQDAEEA